MSKLRNLIRLDKWFGSESKPRVSGTSDPTEPKQKDAKWYDKAYLANETYHKHYTEVFYYPLWTAILSSIKDHQPRRILEIGCGPGQLAHAIRDHFAEIEYCGFDFSPAAVELARRNVPDYRFEVANALATSLYTDFKADLVISTEVLEHIHEDLRIIESLPSGISFIGSVPNFDYKSHVRYFQSEQDVLERYGRYFDDFKVKTFIFNDKGKKFYLLEGNIR